MAGGWPDVLSAGFIDLVLGPVDRVGDLEIVVLAGAAGQQEPGHRQAGIAGQGFARHVVDLARIDVLLLEVGKDGLVEVGADWAGDRGILDHRDLGLGIAQAHLIGRNTAAALVAGGETQHRNHGEYEATVDQGHGSLPDD